MNKIKNKTLELLLKALAKKFGRQVTNAIFETIPLHGGTLGDVKLLSGMAKMSDSTECPF